MQQRKCLGNSDDKADQMAWRNDDNKLEIVKENLELTNKLIICS